MRNIIVPAGRLISTLVHVNSLLKFLCVEESGCDGVAIENSSFKSVYRLAIVLWLAQGIETGSKDQLTRRADKGLVNLTNTGIGVPASRAMYTRSTLPY